MLYTHTTLVEFREQLAVMLGDPAMTFFTSAELTTYIREALTTWGSASLFYRKRDSFLTDTTIPFYDLSAELDSLIMTTKDRDLVSQLEYSLMEKQTTDWLTWAGTEQFSLDTILNSIQKMLNQFLLETGVYLTLTNIENLIVPVSKVAFPQDIMDIRRVAAIDVDGAIRILSLEDEFTLQSYFPDWNINTKSKPDFWTIISSEPLTFRVAPTADDIVSLQLLTIPTGNTLDLEVGQILGIPEAFIWVLKYGVLMDLLGPHTQAADLPRAKYCEMRWQEGIALAKLYTSILNAEVNGRQINISSLSDLDTYKWNWQNQSGVPTEMGVAGWNLIALSPVPSASDVAITIDYVQNPPLPSQTGDFIQIDKAYLSMLLDYCRHIALFKVGGEEFAKSQQGYTRMIQAASLHNSRLRAQSRSFSSLTDNTAQEWQMRTFSETEAREMTS